MQSTAIRNLGQFEIHHENIYTGLAGVLLDVKHLYLKGFHLLFKTHVSFTTSLTQAKQFRGSNGMILGINMKANKIWLKYNQFYCCDVSWISQYHNEKEVLVARLSAIEIRPEKVRTDLKNQNQWNNWWKW